MEAVGKRPALIFTEMTIGMFMSVHCRVAWLVMGYHHGSCHCRSSSAHLRSVLPSHLLWITGCAVRRCYSDKTLRLQLFRTHNCVDSNHLDFGVQPKLLTITLVIFAVCAPFRVLGACGSLQVRNWISSVPRPNLEVSMNSEFSRDRHMFFGLWLSPLQSTCPSVIGLSEKGEPLLA